MLHKRKNLYQISKPSKMIFRNFALADSNCRDNKPKSLHLNQSKKARTDLMITA